MTLHLPGAPSKSSFATASDGHGGTLVYDPPAASTAKIDPHWIEMAMADFGGVANDAHGSTMPHDPLGLAASAELVGHGAEGHPFVP